MSAHDAPPSRPPSEPPQPGRDLRWSAGIVNHGTYDDLERCIAALFRQAQRPTSIVVYDTGEDPLRLDSLRLAHPDVDFQAGPNCGYAGGANRVVDRLTGESESVDFILVLNADIELEPDFAIRLMEGMTTRSRVAIGTGKLLRPDRGTLDSAGIVIPRHRRPRDRGSDQRDLGQFDRQELVDAASGAAMMLRQNAVSDLMIDGELFDERFFAYYEDTDLCWRARLFGWQVLYEPRAVALHQRGWQRARRKEIPAATRRHSFKNYQLQILKNETARGFVRNLPLLLAWEILRLGFAVLRDRSVLPAYRDVWIALPEIRRQRAHVQAKARQRANG